MYCLFCCALLLLFPHHHQQQQQGAQHEQHRPPADKTDRIGTKKRKTGNTPPHLQVLQPTVWLCSQLVNWAEDNENRKSCRQQHSNNNSTSTSSPASTTTTTTTTGATTPDTLGDAGATLATPVTLLPGNVLPNVPTAPNSPPPSLPEYVKEFCQSQHKMRVPMPSTALQLPKARAWSKREVPKDYCSLFPPDAAPTDGKGLLGTLAKWRQVGGGVAVKTEDG
eukprot:TRINITY_DN67030_c6_g1_i2.p2 TRINITY_DN67030_c6_g1~~TRINITY_DN67030_c6_g1_i2.p2  ORF type:complete len:223 (-),score=32.92 TRINITY_DN67030_c6_g1_i2:1066-1734(-)